MSYELLIFWSLAAVTTASAAVAIYAKNIVNAVFGLFVSLLCVAGVYALLQADFLAITQVVIYVGGILVLLLFGILLTNRTLEDLVLSHRRPYVVGILVGAGILCVLLSVLTTTVWNVHPLGSLEGTTGPLGVLLLQKYVIAFEFSSLTLLAALLGASYLVRRKERD